jgi:hypothetical protein
MKERIGTLLWLVTMASLGAWLAVMVLDTAQPYVYDGAESRMIPNVVHPGQTVVADWKLVKVNRHCPGTSQRRFRHKESGNVITPDPTPLAQSTRPGDNRLGREFNLPPHLMFGEYAYSSNICFQCNLLQHLIPTLLCVMTPEISFTVVP